MAVAEFVYGELRGKPTLAYLSQTLAKGFVLCYNSLLVTRAMGGTAHAQLTFPWLGDLERPGALASRCSKEREAGGCCSVEGHLV